MKLKQVELARRDVEFRELSRSFADSKEDLCSEARRFVHAGHEVLPRRANEDPNIRTPQPRVPGRRENGVA